jgi:pectin methylesterase-like acyl-CoA thioesterase
MLRQSLSGLVGASLLLFSVGAAAATLRVPAQFPTIQAAVDAAQAGDRVRVSPGYYCGATLNKPVLLQGVGKPRIVGCASSP